MVENRNIMKFKRRPLTEDELARHKIVRANWLRYKGGNTQRSAAQGLKMHEVTFSQYIGAKPSVPLNTDFILALAKFLNITAEQLDPGMKKLIRKSAKSFDTVLIPLFAKSSGQPIQHGECVVVTVEQGKQLAGLYAITVDTTQYDPGIKKGTTLVMDPIADINKDDYVAIRLVGEETYSLHAFVSETKYKVTVRRPMSMSDGVDTKIDVLKATEEINRGKIASLHKVVSSHFV